MSHTFAANRSAHRARVRGAPRRQFGVANFATHGLDCAAEADAVTVLKKNAARQDARTAPAQADLSSFDDSIRSTGLDKALMLLQVIILDQGRNCLSDIAANVGIPKATAYRIAAALTARGLIVSGAGGVFAPGALMLIAMATHQSASILAHVATPFLKRIARSTRQVVHLGLLEDDMVTYVAKEGSGIASRFTRAHTQLDAYCSGLGKVLLAYLPPSQLEKYLANGTFFKLTANTVTDPVKFRAHLAQIRRRGYSIDDGEFAEDLRCVAVPVTDQNGHVCAAISISGSTRLLERRKLQKAIKLLKMAAQGIEELLYRPIASVKTPTSIRLDDFAL